MRSLNRRFNQRQKANPCWSTWTCFADSIMEQNFKKETIREKFNELVEKDDYEKKDKMQLLKYLYSVSQSS